MTGLPTDPEEKRALLKRGFEIGQRIGELAQVGGLAGPLREYLVAQPELTVELTAGSLIAVYPGDVRWQVSIGADGRIEGMGASGFGPLMAALGIDFSGAPYTAGNGQ